MLFRLTGLLSFMLSDEMTTGSVTSSDGHKRAYAVRSHSFNLNQARFREAFPDVSIFVQYLLNDPGSPIGA
jgi:ubiquitin-conjugating enzyme E2 J2